MSGDAHTKQGCPYNSLKRVEMRKREETVAFRSYRLGVIWRISFGNLADFVLEKPSYVRRGR